MGIPQNPDLREVYRKCDAQTEYGMTRIPRTNDLRNRPKGEAIEEWARKRLAEQRRSFRQQLVRVWWLVNS